MQLNRLEIARRDWADYSIGDWQNNPPPVGEPASASGWADLNQPARMLRLGFDQTSNASRPVKWGCDPFVNERDRFLTYTHGLGGPCYG